MQRIHFGSARFVRTISKVAGPIVLFIALAAFTAQPAVATFVVCPGGVGNDPQDPYVYGPNRGAVYWLERSQDTMDGIRSTEDLTDGWPDNGTAIVHPLQVSSPVNKDFIGWGTVSGLGTNNGIHNCPTNYNNWSIYYDYSKNNGDDYYCYTGLGYVAHGAVDQLFQIRYNDATLCGSNPGWVLALNGDQLVCKSFSWHASHFISAGVEIASDPPGSIDYVISPIDTHYGDLELHGTVTGTWDNWGSNAVPCAELEYSYEVDENSVNDVVVRR